MRFMFLASVYLAAAGLGPICCDRAGAGDKTELAPYQGKWALASLIVDGKKTPEDKLKDQFMIVKGTKSSAVVGDKQRASGSIRIDASKKPAEYDITYDDGPGAGLTLKGVSKLEADTWTIHMSGLDKDRPADFESKAGSGSMLFVFKRVK